MIELETAPAPAPCAELDAVNWFEIPTIDLERATKFYETVLGVTLIRVSFDEPMRIFPSSAKGVGGALVQRAGQQPASGLGLLLYLNCDSGIDGALDRLRASGLGQILLPRTAVAGGFGHYAAILDTEGNAVRLHEH